MRIKRSRKLEREAEPTTAREPETMFAKALETKIRSGNIYIVSPSQSGLSFYMNCRVLSKEVAEVMHSHWRQVVKGWCGIVKKTPTLEARKGAINMCLFVVSKRTAKCHRVSVSNQREGSSMKEKAEELRQLAGSNERMQREWTM